MWGCGSSWGPELAEPEQGLGGFWDGVEGLPPLGGGEQATATSELTERLGLLNKSGTKSNLVPTSIHQPTASRGWVAIDPGEPTIELRRELAARAVGLLGRPTALEGGRPFDTLALLLGSLVARESLPESTQERHVAPAFRRRPLIAGGWLPWTESLLQLGERRLPIDQRELGRLLAVGQHQAPTPLQEAEPQLIEPTV